MIFTLRKTSDWNFKESIDVDTLEQLRELSKKYDANLIINFGDVWTDEKPEIEIYDDYRE